MVSFACLSRQKIIMDLGDEKMSGVGLIGNEALQLSGSLRLVTKFRW